jgi:hypothetical protein
MDGKNEIGRLFSVREEKLAQKADLQTRIDELTSKVTKLDFEIEAISYSLDVLGIKKEDLDAAVSDGEAAKPIEAAAPKSPTKAVPKSAVTAAKSLTANAKAAVAKAKGRRALDEMPPEERQARETVTSYISTLDSQNEVTNILRGYQEGATMEIIESEFKRIHPFKTSDQTANSLLRNRLSSIVANMVSQGKLAKSRATAEDGKARVNYTLVKKKSSANSAETEAAPSQH